MVAARTKILVVNATRPTRASSGNFYFEDDIGVSPRALIRPDKQLINSIRYTVFMSDYYFSALHEPILIFYYT